MDRRRAISVVKRAVVLLLAGMFFRVGGGCKLYAQRRVIVHVLKPAFNEKGDTLSFSIGVYEPVNLSQVLAGTATSLEFREVTDAAGLRLQYTVAHLSQTIARREVAFLARNDVRVPVTKCHGKRKLEIRVSALGDGWEDVTDTVNRIPGSHMLPYGRAEIECVKAKKAELGYLTNGWNWLVASLRKGGGISWILLGVLVWGVVISLLHLLYLFLCPSLSVRALKQCSLDVCNSEKTRGRNVSEHSVGHIISELVSRKAQKIELGLQTGAIQLNEIRSLQSAILASVDALTVSLVGLEVNRPSVGCKVAGLLSPMRKLPHSLESLWNAAVLAPLLGLLGTVLGISSAFQGVKFVSALKDPAAAMSYLSGGINKALYTTVHGLIVGILLMLSFYVCTRRARSIQLAAKEMAENILRDCLVKIAKQHARIVE